MAVTEGKIRLTYTDASMTRQDVVLEADTVLADISTDPRQKIIVGYIKSNPLKEDDMLLMSIQGLTAGDFDSGSTFQIPVTIRNVTTGIVRETMLTVSDFTDMSGAAIGATNIDYGTNFTAVAKYTVKAQEQLKLGYRMAENSRLYVALVVA